jgi:lysyl-tRNA synthetase class 2
MRLRIAPELYLKRLLVGGLDRVYEIGRNYRNEGIDTRHNPEFTMMESYQAYGNFEELILFTTGLLQHVTSYLTMNLPAYAAEHYKTWEQEAPYEFFNFVQVPMLSAVLRASLKAGINVEMDDQNHSVVVTHDLENANARLQQIDVKAMWHALDQSSTNGERVAALFEYVAEPFLAEDYRNPSGTKSLPVFVTDYPKDISPLARTSDSNPMICARFELFVDGRELANAFQELNDPEEQALRFQEQLESNNKDPMDYDADYVEALEHGMPPAIGFGIGIDRLVMLLTNTTSIKDVILFPTLRPEK